METHDIYLSIRCPQPNMFEVHTQGRIFYLSAPSGDDMQSWVGMLETLKQYKKATTLHRAAALKVNMDRIYFSQDI